jgi:hypothetical protein
VPLNTPRRRLAIASAQQVADWDTHAHTGDPDHDLKQNMVRFGYVLRKFGITLKGLGITAHGLRHEALIEEYIAITGQEPPLRGGGEELTREQEEAARLAVSRLAGHNRGRASAIWAPCCTRIRADQGRRWRWRGGRRRRGLHRPPGRRHHGAAVMRAASFLVVDDTKRSSLSASVRADGVSDRVTSRVACSMAVGTRAAMSRAC